MVTRVCSGSITFCFRDSYIRDFLYVFNIYRVIRFVFKDKNTPCCDLLKQLGRATLAEQRARKILGTIFKTLHGPCP